MELYPGGPVELPTTVVFGDHPVTVDMGALQVAHAVSVMDWRAIIPHGLTRRDRDTILRRLDDRRDPLTYAHIDAAAIRLAVRLCGIDTGIKGYRSAVKMCLTLMQNWPIASGVLSTNGVDVARDPLWRTCAAMYRLWVEPPEEKEEERINRRTYLFEPISGEPKQVFADAGKRVRVVTVQESAAAWAENKRLYDSITARTRA